MTCHPLRVGINAQQEACYVHVPNHADYIDLVQDLATECAFHLAALGITWEDCAGNADGFLGPSVENALIGALYDRRNNATD